MYKVAPQDSEVGEHNSSNYSLWKILIDVSNITGRVHLVYIIHLGLSGNGGGAELMVKTVIFL